MDSIKTEVRGCFEKKVREDSSCSNQLGVSIPKIYSKILEKNANVIKLVYNTPKHPTPSCILIFRHNINII